MKSDKLAIAILIKLEREAKLNYWKRMAYFWLDAYHEVVKDHKVNFEIKHL